MGRADAWRVSTNSWPMSPDRTGEDEGVPNGRSLLLSQVDAGTSAVLGEYLGRACRTVVAIALDISCGPTFASISVSDGDSVVWQRSVWGSAAWQPKAKNSGRGGMRIQFCSRTIAVITSHCVDN
jgi:hypothetical protein